MLKSLTTRYRVGMLAVAVAAIGVALTVVVTLGYWPVQATAADDAAVADVQFTAEARSYQHAAIATDHEIASQAGLEMLQKGGNAVDAAVAASFCLAVVRPESCGLGGGGFMLIHIPADEESPARQVAINYRETAPGAVGPDYYEQLDDPQASRFGVKAVGVPGTVAGLLHALENYGTLDRATVLAPAIRAASEGFAVDAFHINNVRDTAKVAAEQKQHHLEVSITSSWLDSKADLEVGATDDNPQLASALQLIAEEGADAFYRGRIGESIVNLMNAFNGPITMADLNGYEVEVIEPLRGRFGAYEVLSMPPPSSGGIAMQQILGMLERHQAELAQLEHNDAQYVQLVTEAMKHAFADRARWLADDDFVDVPTHWLLSDEHLDAQAQKLKLTQTNGPSFYGNGSPPPDDAGTSHLCVIDANGMAVSCTETVNLAYGSLTRVPEFGFALNNEMDDFTTISGEANAFGLQQSDRNLPEPGKRPLSSMSPTIVLKDGRAVLVNGAAGGPRIISATLQTMLNSLMFEMPTDEAMAVPRFHHQWMPNVLFVENQWSDDGVLESLREIGHDIQRRDTVGKANLIRVGKDGIHAAGDPRKGGAPAGY